MWILRVRADSSSTCWEIDTKVVNGKAPTEEDIRVAVDAAIKPGELFQPRYGGEGG